MKLYILVGTRPNFIKITQFKKVSAKWHPNLTVKIIHTGQHYDEKMADVFFKQFSLIPDYYLNVSPASPNKQIAEIMMKLEDCFNEIGKPDMLLVPGDVNSTMAGAITANKLGIKLGHIEAGLRSFDKTMPEEFNRVVTDSLSDIFFVTEPSGRKHLESEGKSKETIFDVGNTMMDTIIAYEQEIENANVLHDLNLVDEKFILMTMHRPATVDDKVELTKLIHLITDLGKRYKIVFPIHPRTLKNIKLFNLEEHIKNNASLKFTEPLDYFSFQKLIKYCRFIITDSGGIQEESTFRKKPCITLRPNTERPVTVDIGTNTLLEFDLEKINAIIKSIEGGTYKKGAIPNLWDGKATQRILEIITKQ